jgi:hypothetical protein
MIAVTPCVKDAYGLLWVKHIVDKREHRTRMIAVGIQ